MVTISKILVQQSNVFFLKYYLGSRGLFFLLILMFNI